MRQTTLRSEEIATQLLLSMRLLRSRIREESLLDAVGISISQLSILHYLHKHGSATASALSTKEHVSQQAIAQNIAPLKAAGLVEAKTDQNDKRKTLVSITATGRAVLKTVADSRNAWLSQAIDGSLGQADLITLQAATEIMEKLANSNH